MIRNFEKLPTDHPDMSCEVEPKDYPPYLDYPKERKPMTNMEWLCKNQDKMVKIMVCPYKAFLTINRTLMAKLPGFGCKHPMGDIACDECKKNWLKSPVDKEETE